MTKKLLKIYVGVAVFAVFGTAGIMLASYYANNYLVEHHMCVEKE